MVEMQIRQDDPFYPSQLIPRMAESAPAAIHAVGNPDIMRQPAIGFLCSVQCPGSIILKTFDAIRILRDKGIVVIGGFHSPMERECLDLLLRGSQPVILCSAKGLNRLKLGKSARTALKENRLLLMSPFDRTIRRTTAARAIIRNNLVAAMSVAMLIPHSTTGGKIWQTARQSIERGHPVFIFDDYANTGLKNIGAKADSIDIVCNLIFQCLDRIKTPCENHGQIK